MDIEEVKMAANRAADDLLDKVAHLGDSQRDLINLMVNIFVTYCEAPGINLIDAIASNYKDDSVDEVLSWL